VLQTGKPANDVLLYVPFHDFWQTNDNAMLKTFAMPGTWMESQPVHALAMELEKKGYGYDEVSDRLLEAAKVENRKIVISGQEYASLLIPPCKYMPVSTLKKLVEIRKAGAWVSFLESPPQDVPGLGRLDERRKEFKALTAEAQRDGRIFIVKDLAAAMGMGFLGNSATVIGDGLRTVRRQLPDGNAFLVVNTAGKPFDDKLKIYGKFESVILADPMYVNRSGRVIPDRFYEGLGTSQKGPAVLPLQLQPGESRLLWTFARRDDRSKLWRETTAAGDSVPLKGTWTVEFLDGGPVLPKGYETAELKSWTTRDDPEL
jgi:hypothetical protein